MIQIYCLIHIILTFVMAKGWCTHLGTKTDPIELNYTRKHKITCTHIFVGKQVKQDARIFLNNTLNILLMDYQ